MSADVVVGVDAGASKTVARLVLDGRGTPVAVRGVAGNPVRLGVAGAATAIAGAVTELLRRSDLDPVLVACGVAGAGDAVLAEELRSTLTGLLGRPVHVTTDVEAALLATAPSGPAAVVIAGTGAVALARDGSGATRRAGGGGLFAGDPGSGPWIAGRYAGCARAEDVDRAAAGGDSLGRRILDEAAAELARLVEAAASADLAGPLGLVGGVLGGSARVRDALVERLAASRPRLVPGAPAVSPEVGAVRAARMIDV